MGCERKKNMPVADVRGPITETPRILHVRNIRDMTENSASYTCTGQHRSVVLFIGYFAISPHELQSQVNLCSSLKGNRCMHFRSVSDLKSQLTSEAPGIVSV